jgi:hypothetical protein
MDGCQGRLPRLRRLRKQIKSNSMEHLDEEPESENGDQPSWTLPRFQFSLATLMGVVTGTALLCGLIKWWGLIPVLFLIGSAAGTFLGLLVCNYFGLGFAFENLRADMLKCFLIPGAAMAAWFLISLIPMSPALLRSTLIINFLIFWIGMKMAWLDIEMYEIIICFIGALFSGLGLLALVDSIYPLVNFYS